MYVAAEALNPPIQYSLIWLIIGSLILLVVIAWYVFVFWSTRKRPIKQLGSLKELNPHIDIESLRKKYLKMIDMAYKQYLDGEINLRKLHKVISLYSRYFVYETKGFPAPRLTLSDLKNANYPQLTQLIDEYYTHEFALIETANAETSVAAAKGFIEKWS